MALNFWPANLGARAIVNNLDLGLESGENFLREE